MPGSGYAKRSAEISCTRTWRCGIEYHVSPILEQLMISLQVFYEGHVQGVGFRFIVRHIAKGFDVTGWVRNLPDGRVELQVMGDEGEVRAFLDQVAQSELHSLIRKQTENRLNEAVATRGFDIRYD
jgi:acylphosphatase